MFPISTFDCSDLNYKCEKPHFLSKLMLTSRPHEILSHFPKSQQRVSTLITRVLKSTSIKKRRICISLLQVFVQVWQTLASCSRFGVLILTTLYNLPLLYLKERKYHTQDDKDP